MSYFPSSFELKLPARDVECDLVFDPVSKALLRAGVGSSKPKITGAQRVGSGEDVLVPGVFELHIGEVSKVLKGRSGEPCARRVEFRFDGKDLHRQSHIAQDKKDGEQSQRVLNLYRTILSGGQVRLTIEDEGSCRNLFVTFSYRFKVNPAS